jgi:hypothetical protein
MDQKDNKKFGIKVFFNFASQLIKFVLFFCVSAFEAFFIVEHLKTF